MSAPSCEPEVYKSALGWFWRCRECKRFAGPFPLRVNADESVARVHAVAYTNEDLARAWQRGHDESCEMAGNCWGGGCPLHENPYVFPLDGAAS